MYSPSYIPEEEFLKADSWRPDPVPMNSAYKLVHGEEPEFTNFAQTKVLQNCLRQACWVSDAHLLMH